MNIVQLFDRVYTEIQHQKIPFFLVFFAIVFLTYAILFAIDFIPEPVLPTQNEQESDEQIQDNNTTTEQPQEVKQTVTSPLPLKIIFDSSGKQIVVLNPVSRNVADLDTALLSGAVRHPDSANFENDGNIFILGHSSYLPTVFNKNFKAFNGIQDLIWGDTIRLQSADTEYTYRVQKVYEAKTSEVTVPQTPGKARLTLATCNSFGSKEDRFIVEAALINSKRL